MKKSKDKPDALNAQADAAQALAAAMPHNANKALEIGHANALTPPRGQTVKPRSALATASTLSEFWLSPIATP